MSLTRNIEISELELETSKLINRMIHLCQGCHQVEISCYSDEINLPTFGRLFELIRQLESMYVEEIIRFQISRGQKITWFDVKPVENLENKPIEMFKKILDLEVEIHEMTLKLSKHAWNKLDLALSSFLDDRVTLRQIKVLRKRSNQMRDLKRNEDDINSFLICQLNAKLEVEKLEKHLLLQITRRELKTCNSKENNEIYMIGSTNKF